MLGNSAIKKKPDESVLAPPTKEELDMLYPPTQGELKASKAEAPSIRDAMIRELSGKVNSLQARSDSLINNSVKLVQPSSPALRELPSAHRKITNPTDYEKGKKLKKRANALEDQLGHLQYAKTYFNATPAQRKEMDEGTIQKSIEALGKGIAKGFIGVPRIATTYAKNFASDPMARILFSRLDKKLKKAQHTKALQPDADVKGLTFMEAMRSPRTAIPYFMAPTGESVPMIVAGMLGGAEAEGAGWLGRLVATSLNIAPFTTTSQLQRLDQHAKKMGKKPTMGDKVLALGTGVLGAAAFGAGEAPLYKNIVKSITKSGLDKAAKEELKKTIGRRLVDVGKAYAEGTLKLSPAMAANTVISNAGAKVGWNPKGNLFEGVPEALVSGTLMGGLPLAGARGIREFRLGRRARQVRKITEEHNKAAERENVKRQTAGDRRQKPKEAQQPITVSLKPEAPLQEQIKHIEGEQERLKNIWQARKYQDRDVSEIDQALSKLDRLRAEKEEQLTLRQAQGSKQEEKPVISEPTPEELSKIKHVKAGETLSSFRTIPVKDIHTDTKLFQNREKAYSEQTKNSIVEDVKEGKIEPENITPIKVWQNPADNKLYVVGGHSRLAAFKELGVDKIPVHILRNMSRKEASELGKTDNALGTQETLPEQANIVRRWRDEGKSQPKIKKETQKLFGKNAKTVRAFSALNPHGKALDTYRALLKNETGDRTQAEKFAKWVGEARLRHPELTNSHETELYNYLLNNNNENTRLQSNFLDFVNKVVDRNTVMGQFDASKPLNIESVKPQTHIVSEAQKRVKQARTQLKDAQKKHADKIKEIESRKANGEAINQKQADNILRGLEDKIKRSQRDVIAAQNDLSTAKKQSRNQSSLFAPPTKAELQQTSGVNREVNSRARERIAQLFDTAKDVKDHVVRKVISSVSPEEAKKLNNETGIDINNSYSHTIDNYAIRHTMTRHGGDSEYSKNQIPITKSDFERIPQVIHDYDSVTPEKNKRGQDVLVYKKAFGDGTTLYVEEKRTGQNELAMVSMRKKGGKPGVNHADTEGSVPPLQTSETSPELPQRNIRKSDESNNPDNFSSTPNASSGEFANEPVRQGHVPNEASEAFKDKAKLFELKNGELVPIEKPTSQNRMEIQVEGKSGDIRDVQLGDLDKINGMQMPMIVRMFREITGDVPTVSTRMSKAQGAFYPIGDGKIRLKADIFKDPVMATKVLAHEIGHWIDYMPDKTMKRGNVLGRLKSMRRYLKHTVEGAESTGRALTKEDQQKLRRQARKDVYERSNVTRKDVRTNKALRDRINKEIKDQYHKSKQAEIKRRGLITKEGLTNELKALSMRWRPYNPEKVPGEYIKYRNSSRELYADALSAMLVSPGTVEQTSPIFYREFFAHIDNKPKIKKAYLDMQAWLNYGEAAVAAINDHEIGMMSQRTEDQAKKLVDYRDKSKTSLVEDIRQTLIWRFFPVVKKARNAAKAGIISKDTYQSLLYTLEEMDYHNNDVTLYADQLMRQIVRPLEEHGITTIDMHKYLFANRIANEHLTINKNNENEVEFKEITDKQLQKDARDFAKQMTGDPASTKDEQEWGRAILANPLGFTKEAAQGELRYMREELLGEERFNYLEKQMRLFQELNFEVAKRANQAGIISDDIFTNIIEPDKYNYATFRVKDYIEDPDWVSAAIKESKGTFKDIANVFESTMLKHIAFIKQLRVNEAKNEMLKVWDDIFPGEIERAERIGQGAYRKPQDKEHLFVWEDGKRVPYNVDPYIEKAFKLYHPSQFEFVIKGLRWLNNHVFRPIFITYNPSFAFYSNIIRDPMRLWVNVKQASIPKIIGGYVKSWSDAIDYAKGNIDNPRLKQLLDDAAIVPPAEAWVLKGRDDGFARQVRRTYLASEKGKIQQRLEQYKAVRGAAKMGQWMRQAQTVGEIISKLAADRILSDVPGVSRRDKAYVIRNRVGTPNWLRGGTGKRQMNAIAMFSNVAIQGYKSDLQVAVSPKSRGAFWMRVFMINVLPKLFASAAINGLFGNELQEFYDRVTEYDMTNYIPIPLGFAGGGASGKRAIYMRIPQDEFGRIAGATVHKVLAAITQSDHERTDNFLQIFGFYSGQFPSLSPSLNILRAWFQYAILHMNPYDLWKGRPIIPERLQVARPANGIPAFKRMVFWTIDQGGLTHLALPNSGDEGQTWNEFIFRTTPILNRAIRITDYGLTQKMWNQKIYDNAVRQSIRISYGKTALGIVTDAYQLRELGDRRTTKQDREYQIANSFYQQIYLRFDDLIQQAHEKGNKKQEKRLRKIIKKKAKQFRKALDNIKNER